MTEGAVMQHQEQGCESDHCLSDEIIHAQRFAFFSQACLEGTPKLVNFQIEKNISILKCKEHLQDSSVSKALAANLSSILQNTG